MTDYPYPGTLVADPITFQRAANAMVTVYDANDTTNSTPLALKDMSGLPMANPVKSSADAFIPPMICPTEGRKLVGAGLTVIEFSPDGIRAAATAAATAAQTAADNAASAAAMAQAPTDNQVDAGINRANIPSIVSQVLSTDSSVVGAAASLAQSNAGLVQKVDPGVPSLAVSDDILVAITDADNRATFLSASAKDGGPTEHSANLIAQRMTPDRLGLGVTKPSVEDVIGGLVDANDNQTWLMARASDGGPTKNSVRHLAVRLGNARTVVGIGDSLTAGGEWLARAASNLGFPTVNMGQAGQTSTEVAIRQGGIVPLMTVSGDTIPAYGPVDITAITPTGAYRGAGQTSVPFTYKGTLAGVLGTFTHYSNETPLRRTFTRTAGGAAVPCPPNTPFYAAQGVPNKLGTQIIWVGRNNIFTDPTPSILLRDVDAMISTLGPGARYLVLSVTNGQTEPSGSTAYNQIKALNDALAATYGDRYLDVRRYLIDYGLQDAGLTATAADNTAISEDRIPPSLHVDSIHFTAAGYQAAGNAISAKISTLGWMN